MKKYCAALFLFSVIVLGACNKYPKCDEVTNTAPASEIATLKSYIETNKIDATADSRGFYYHIDDAGSGKKPGSCYNVNINYIGKLTNGTIFDQQTGISFDLSSLIPGWQEGLPLIAKRGYYYFIYSTKSRIRIIRLWQHSG